MTNCPGLPETKQVLSTDTCQLTNRASPEQMGKTGLLREQLPITGETLAAVFFCLFVFVFSTLWFFFLLFFSFIFISWRLIISQHFSGFCHTLTWISHGFTCIPHPGPPPTSLSTQSLWIFPVHQARALVSCIQPGLVICFTIDNIHVSMLMIQKSWKQNGVTDK